MCVRPFSSFQLMLKPFLAHSGGGEGWVLPQNGFGAFQLSLSRVDSRESGLFLLLLFRHQRQTDSGNCSIFVHHHRFDF